jgi:hypothetical protein
MHVPVPIDTASLGLSLQYSPLALATNIWHVLDVSPNSPADVAGLLPYSDYILGSPEGALHGESALGELVEDFIGRPLQLYVYNHEYDVTREVTINPNRGWGGDGMIGCTLSFGALHRLPAPLSEPINAPGETMFDGGNDSSGGHAPTRSAEAPAGDSSDYLVPAQMVESAPKSTSPAPGKKKEKPSHSRNNFMDDYFKEEEEKSRKLENTPQTKSSSVAPPPKAGSGPPKDGPPRASEAAEA